ncbi:carbohydrate ABC transporter permease [Carboxydochorda subterranea]|uniref:Carbohydrate ABC transporter permease n=1 Tax=Carboxydichorda subterranea TaxID=3109565 RepID=A0ABZ1BW60_9FIRM|nr:carbohydrate ABC transporter permease [Limnochorda sp. L945t]WRP16372.1 carbohydrate ABC transporter permease [Limnochorda sp. L945t]
MKRRDDFVRYAVQVALVAGAVLVAVPFLWMLVTSLKEPDQVFTQPIHWVPHPVRWRNYVEAWQAAPFARYFLNSAVVAVVTTAGQLVVSAMAAYAFARLDFYLREPLFALFLGTMMIPEPLRLVPNFLVLSRLGWIDTYLALTVPWMISVFSIFLLRQFFQTIPQELEDAAAVDGCPRWRFLTQILVPLARPAVLTAGLFTFIGSWNAFLWPLIVTNRETMRPIQVGVATFFQEYGTLPNLAMAASTMAVAPVLLFFFLVQRQFIEGIIRTGLKG